MALIEIKLNPTARDLKWFGVLALVFFGIVGALVYAGASTPVPAVVIWSIGVVFFLVYYATRPLQIVLYRGWLKLFQPLGWVIAHLLFGLIYFVVFTLIGFALRIFRYDSLHRRRAPGAATYWTQHDSAADSSRYFRQF